jgi:hypothetical protein
MKGKEEYGDTYQCWQQSRTPLSMTTSIHIPQLPPSKSALSFHIIKKLSGFRL